MLDDAEHRILVVDDDAMIREAVAKRLTRVGYQVILAADAEQGLRELDASPPSVVLLDLRMPGMDGHTFLRRIQRLTETVTAIMSAHGDIDDVIEVMRHGAVDYLRKPFTSSDLLTVVAHAIEIHSGRVAARLARGTATTITGTTSGAAPTPATVRPASDGEPSVQDHLERIKRGELAIPSIPSVVSELRALVQRRDATAREVATVIERDPRLLSAVLKLGRSALYAGMKPASDLTTLVSRVGLAQIQDLAETAWINDCFRLADRRYHAMSLQILERSVARAVAARAIANTMGIDASLAYRCGLLADIGACLLLTVVDATNGTDHASAPDRCLGVVASHHPAMGAQVLAKWGYEELVIRIARLHHTENIPASPSPHWIAFVLASEVANRLCSVDDLTASGPWPSPQMLSRCAAAASISEATLPRLIETVKPEIESVIASLT